MRGYAATQIDNRDASQMYEYLEARIEVLKRRVAELEKENRQLQTEHTADASCLPLMEKAS